MALRQSLVGLTRRFGLVSLAPFQSIRTIATTPARTAAKPNEEQEDTMMPSMMAPPMQLSKDLSTSLEPYAGRSLAITGNPSGAYRRLNAILNQNNVKRELRANTNYEKPNVARRRINIQRNRKLFGAMIRKKVALIMQMKQRGM
ncbi:hypothetical protein CLU79DRAFT_740381 [Phycomyces nitens]|nr:hypothetical protein CLU79DRAFT_740381 [Phycomyces nitens]